MSSSHAHPTPATPGGASSSESAPQVVVRAGKTFICSACGTLVEVPADVVGRLVVAVVPSADDPPSEPSSAEKTPPKVDPPQEEPAQPARQVPSGQTILTEPRRPAQQCVAEGSSQPRPARPRRPHRPQREPFTGEVIDGLVVPTARQWDRALAWVSFHRNVLDRQGSELWRLKKLRKQDTTSGVPCHEARGHAQAAPAEAAARPSERASQGDTDEDRGIAMIPAQRHAQADLGVAPEMDDVKERGPP